LNPPVTLAVRLLNCSIKLISKATYRCLFVLKGLVRILGQAFLVQIGTLFMVAIAFSRGSILQSHSKLFLLDFIKQIKLSHCH